MKCEFKLYHFYHLLKVIDGVNHYHEHEQQELKKKSSNMSIVHH